MQPMRNHIKLLNVFVSVTHRILNARTFGIESEVILTVSLPDIAKSAELYVYDVTDDIVNELRTYLESSKNDGGKIKQFTFDKWAKAARVTFDDHGGKFYRQ